MSDTSSHRVLRGGGWVFSDHYCGSAARNHYAPAGCFGSYGFRVASSARAPR